MSWLNAGSFFFDILEVATITCPLMETIMF